MKKETFFIFLLIACLFAHNHAIPQRQAWSYLLDDKANTKCIDLDETATNDYVVNAIATKSGSVKLFTLLLKINNEGMLIDTIQFISENLNISPVSTYIDSENLLSLICLEYDTATHAKLSLTRTVLDANFEVVERNTVSLSSELVVGSFSQSSRLSDSSYLVYFNITEQSSKLETPLVCHLDKHFNLLKSNIPSPGQWGSYVDMRQLNDTAFWALRMMSTRYIKLDTSFSDIGQASIPYFSPANMSCKWVNDSTFYVLGSNSFPLPSNNIGILKQYHPYDTTGHLFLRWHHTDTIDFPSIYRGIDFKNSDTLLAGGTHNLSLYNPYYAHQPSWLVVLQTDSLLNLRWERFYGGDAYYVMSNLIATQDGGCLIGGWRFDYQNSTEDQTDIFLLKLNSEGLLTGHAEMPEFQMREAIVYPNPGRQLHIRLAMQHPKAQLQLFDQAGRLILKQQLHQTESTVVTAHLPSGVYLYHLSAPTGLNESGKWVKE